MSNRIIYRFIVSRIDEKICSSNKLFKQFINLYEETYFNNIPIKLSFNYSSMNKNSIYIHSSCKYPSCKYSLSDEDEDDEDYEYFEDKDEKNAVLTGIEIADIINDKCLNMTNGKYFSKDGIIIILDLVIVNTTNCSDMIDELMMQ